jgi:ribonucleotide reductase beta subunit family protein with ferritin-like domain
MVVSPSVPVISVTGILKLAAKAATFCFNEPERHVGFFNGIATGQSETYSLLIDTYIKNNQEKDHLFNAIQTIPCIAKKADWALRWIENKEASFATRLLGFACVEGIFFSGAFCAIFWMKERGVMPGLCLSNEFISRDEGLHTEFAVLLYSMLRNRLSTEQVHNIVKEAVEIEDEFINESIPCNLLGMNAHLMSQYIKFVADRLLVQLGYEKVWNLTNPFDFMDRIGLENKSNFFEHTRISEYAKANVGGTGIDSHLFSLNEEF